MDIDNVGEFVKYCQDHADDASLPDTVRLADRWSSFSERLGRQYGGHGQSMDEWIDDALKRMNESDSSITPEKILQVREIMTRFWKHGSEFERWFQSKVIVV